MKLTRQQQAMVSAFLRERDERQRHLDPRTRMKNLSVVRDRLREALGNARREAIGDAELESVLERMRIRSNAPNRALEGAKTLNLAPETRRSVEVPKPGSPAESTPPEAMVAVRSLSVGQEHPARKSAEPERLRRHPRHPFASSRRRWLGVCLELSEQSGYSVNLIRAGFVLAGVFAAPIAILAYLGIYLERYRTINPGAEEIPKINTRSVTRFTGSIAAVLAFLFIITVVGIRVLEAGYIALFEQAPRLAISDSFASSYMFAFIAASLALIPLAALAAMPLAGEWGETMKKVVKAALGVFALYICLGFASYLAGALASAARTWVG